MKLSPAQIKTLQALHRDVCSKDELDHRFADGHAADELVKAGLARAHAGIYSITVQGREAFSVARREAAAVPKFNQPVVAYESKKAETISINQALDITELSAPQSGIFKAPVINSEAKQMKGESMNAVIENHTSKDIVNLVISRTQINKFDLYEMFPKVGNNNRKRIHIDVSNLKIRGVLKEDNGQIIVGENIDAWLANQSKKSGKTKKIKAARKSKVVKQAEPFIPTFLRRETVSADAETEVETAPTVSEKSSIPTLVEAIHASLAEATDATDVDFQFEYPAKATDSFEEARAETKRDYELLQKRARFAFTEDKTMLIMTPSNKPVELSADETKRLLNFAYSVAMVGIGVN